MTDNKFHESRRRGLIRGRSRLGVRRAGFISAGAFAVACGLMVVPVTLASVSESVLPAAYAAITGFQNAKPASTIDLNRTVDLTLMVPDPRNFEPQNHEEAPRGGNSGYSITVTRLDVAPINTDEGYKAAAGLDAYSLKDVNKGESFTQVTDANGVAKFEGLRPGAYLVKASVPADSSKYYPQPQDMVVVVPTVGEAGEWNYSPTVIAKFLPKDCVCPPNEPCPPVPPVVPPTTPERPTPSGDGKPSGSLAVTGVQAAGLVGIAAVLIGIGFAVLAVNRKKRDDQGNV